MCGLAGRFHPERLAPEPGWIAEADARLAHRGPDGAGSFADERCELVHRRLALLDLSPTGAQPMPNEDARIQVVFNGEIYNHHELRRGLAALGHRFRGTSDTEVLVHLYEEDGPAFVRRLRGIFAIALYDAQRRRLVLARDRFGVKPLYLSRVSPAAEWCFASEMKAILASPRVGRRLDRQACFDFIGLGFIPEPQTGFVDIEALSPGTVRVIDPDGVRSLSFDVPTAHPTPARDLDPVRDETAALLLAAVSRQSEADVPVGALLSGGIDSSLVVAAHERALGAPPETFSVGFPDAAYDESEAARVVAAHCGARHHAIDAAADGIQVDELFSLLRHFDQPFADVSCIPTYWVARALRERGFVCALSGDGGDEAFGGYPRFWQAETLVTMMNAPAWLRGAGARGARALTHVTRDTGRQLAKALSLADDGRSDPARLVAGLSNYLTEREKRDLVMPAARAGLATSDRLFDAGPSHAGDDLEALSRRLTDTMFRLTLPGDMLRKVDMMSMRAGVEIRVPMLDEDVVQMGLGLPHRLKTDGRKGKLVLRALADAWLPREIAHRPKKGFGVPLDVLAPPDLADAMTDLLLGPASRTGAMLDQATVAGWLALFRGASRSARAARATGGRISRGGIYQRLITLTSLELWLRDNTLSW
jgi:asparagine synthase (glutamine-hydrolysing)